MYKKICAIMMAVVMTLSMVACQGQGDGASAQSNEKNSEVSEVTENVAEEKAEASGKEEVASQEESTAEDISEAVEETVSEEELEKQKEAKMNELKKEVVESTPEEAMAFAANLKAGWNLGNTFDAWNAGELNSLNSETCWGNPKVTKEFINTVKDAGFTTIRVPVSWHNHLTLSEDGKHLIIDAEWLARVKEVVDYCMDADLYTIINIHHDNIPEGPDGKFGFRPDKDNAEQSIWYAAEIWTQVAEYFKDYDNRLIFEGLNEPRLTNDSAHEWSYENDNHIYNTAADIINKMNQAFVDAVRLSGGNNVNRYLLVTSYCATLKAAKSRKYIFPEDIASNKIMLSFHAYSPYDFALNPDISLNVFDKESAEKEYNSIAKQVAQYINEKGIPAVLTEYGAQEKNGNLADRVEYYKTYCGIMADNGIASIVWDNGTIEGANYERFALFNRKTDEVLYPDIINAIVDSYN